jgi:hypothetical protein
MAATAAEKAAVRSVESIVSPEFVIRVLLLGLLASS